MKTETTQTEMTKFEKACLLIDMGVEAYEAKYGTYTTEDEISASEPIKYKIDTISHTAIDNSNLLYNNASESVVDTKVEDAKVFAQSAKDYKEFQVWDKNNKANSKPVDISVPVVKSSANKSTDEMLNDFNTFNFKKFTKQKWPMYY